MKKDTEFLIIGQGIAGTLLAFEFLKRGRSFLICEGNLPGAASVAAQGVLNPVLLKWYSTSWNHEIFFPSAFRIYKDLEQKLNRSFFKDQPVSKIFHSLADRNLWIKKMSSMPQLREPQNPSEQLNAPFGSGDVDGCAGLNIRSFLSASGKLFMEKELFLDAKISYDEIKPGYDKALYKGHSFKKIIFAEGFRSTGNPWFGFLPFKPVKGDTLTIRIDQHLPPGIWSRSIFLVPEQENIYRAGATYSWEELDSGPSTDARNEMESKIKGMLNVPFSVIGHESGVRPASDDRRPFLGCHPQWPSLATLNGFGSKGLSMGPWLAKHLADHLLDNSPLDPESDIKRFF